MVLLINHIGWLQPFYCQLKVVCHYEGRGCKTDLRWGFISRTHPCSSKVTIWQWIVLPIVELAEYLNDRNMKHVRGRPLHPQTQGKIERYHRSMKNVVKLDNYYSPGQLEHKMKQFVQYYNYDRYHESINNLTPSEVYYGTGERKLKRRKRIKQ